MNSNTKRAVRNRAPELDFTLALKIEETLEAYPSIQHWFNKVEKSNFQFLATRQRRGYCRYAEGIITLPEWLLKEPLDYFCWYLMHEVAHIFSPTIRDLHGLEFMQCLKKICPPECAHYELTYNPKNATLAGIAKPLRVGDSHDEF